MGGVETSGQAQKTQSIAKFRELRKSGLSENQILLIKLFLRSYHLRLITDLKSKTAKIECLI